MSAITREKTKNKKTDSDLGFGVVGLLLIITALVSLGGIGFYVYQQRMSSSTKIDRSDPSNEASKEVCHDQDGIEVCAWIEDISPTYADGYRLLAEFKNTSDNAFEYTFSSGCTSPTKIVNGSARGSLGMCTMALTPVSIAAGSSREFSAVFTPNMLEDGQNTVQLTWAEVVTPEFTIDQLELTETDKELLRERCVRSERIATGCDLLTVYVKDSGAFDTYADIDSYLEEQYGLGVHYDSFGISPDDEPRFSVSMTVPTFEKDYYFELLNNDSSFSGAIDLPF